MVWDKKIWKYKIYLRTCKVFELKIKTFILQKNHKKFHPGTTAISSISNRSILNLWATLRKVKDHDLHYIRAKGGNSFANAKLIETMSCKREVKGLKRHLLTISRKQYLRLYLEATGQSETKALARMATFSSRTTPLPRHQLNGERYRERREREERPRSNKFVFADHCFLIKQT